ncbi:PREDICTED: F-box protein CPR30-like [Prunus mume]|uniref:F-box protein CPR30-like n=1 Tax=Prunus mume TaxID=102107 RepID=A0ABM0NCB2_PRUMU|nr:PREDICTED: F-box protein CPR30-like [Prunus mume]
MTSTNCKNSIYIPEEILIDILLRLPVKSLVQFMCVCKSWSNLIESSSFIGRHLNRNVKNHGLTFLVGLECTEVKPKIRHSIFSNETFKATGLDMGGFGLYGSSNGLVCLSCKSLDLDCPVTICNPSIMKFVRLPVTNVSCPPKYQYRCVLTFGFNSRLNDYKVVRLVTFIRGKKYNEVEVYSLSTNSWKSIGVIPPWIYSLGWHSGHAVSDGIAYWIMGQGEDDSFHLVSFDTGSEVFEQVLLPEAIAEGLEGVEGEIQAYKESVCLLQCERSEPELHVGIWVLQEKCLNKMHTVVIPGIWPMPLGFKTNDELLVNYVGKKGEIYLAIYNLQTKQINETRVSLPKHCSLDSDAADTYVESLLLLKGWSIRT